MAVPGGNISNFPVDFLANRFLSLVMEMCPEATPTGNYGNRQLTIVTMATDGTELETPVL